MRVNVGESDSSLGDVQWLQWSGSSSQSACSADCQLGAFIFTHKFIVLHAKH